MAAPWKNQRLRPSNTALNCLDVAQRAIFIVFALNDQSGARNRAEIFFNVPLAKLRIEPNIIPSAEHFVDVIVILQSSRWDWNDLASTQSVWSITFLDERPTDAGAATRA